MLFLLGNTRWYTLSKLSSASGQHRKSGWSTVLWQVTVILFGYSSHWTISFAGKCYTLWIFIFIVPLDNTGTATGLLTGNCHTLWIFIFLVHPYNIERTSVKLFLDRLWIYSLGILNKIEKSFEIIFLHFGSSVVKELYSLCGCISFCLFICNIYKLSTYYTFSFASYRRTCLYYIVAF